MNVLTVISHPRPDSLTFRVADRFLAGLRDAGHESEVLDLHRAGFDPVMDEADEPDWTAERQCFSPEVHREMARMEAHDGLAFVFPLWWWSMPAMLKGYIDRVWNYGFAYGGRKLPQRRVLWLALAGVPQQRFEKHGYDDMIRHYFDVGLASYVGIPQSKVVLLYETVQPQPGCVEQWLVEGYRAGRDYDAA